KIGTRAVRILSCDCIVSNMLNGLRGFLKGPAKTTLSVSADAKPLGRAYFYVTGEALHSARRRLPFISNARSLARESLLATVPLRSLDRVFPSPERSRLERSSG